MIGHRRIGRTLLLVMLLLILAVASGYIVFGHFLDDLSVGLRATLFMAWTALVVFGAYGYLNAVVVRRLSNLHRSMSSFVAGQSAEIPTDGDDELGAMGRALDYLVTTLKRREATLEDQLDFQKTLLDTIPNPIYYKDNDGRFMVVNAAFEAVVGLPPNRVVGKTPFEIDRPDLAERFDPEDRDMGEGKRRYSYETQKTFADGRTHHVMMEKARFVNAEGKSTGVAAVIVDITRLKVAETELQEAKEVAESANLAKSSFLAAMSHEIRTPMNGVTGMVELLKDTRLSTDQMDMLQTVHDSADALLLIIDDILDFSKIEAGRMDLDQIPASIEATVQSVAETLAPSLRRRGGDVTLVTFSDPALPETVIADPVRLRQILMNLGGNAMKFTEAGRVTITANMVSQGVDRVKVRFDVHDTGIGIAEQDQAKLFEAFTQAEGSITRRFGGTGLGLSISKRLVDLMGGEIGLESRLGQGSTFWFELPMAYDASGPEIADVSSDLEDLAELRVSVCIEDPSERAFLYTYLSDAPVKLSVAANVGEMLERVSLQDVVIFDSWGGSGGNGEELMQAMRDECGDRHPGLVWLDGAVSDEAMILSRPYSRRRLYQAVAMACGRRPLEIVDTLDTDAPPAVAVPSVERARAEGRLILAVEDHPVNQKVLMRQLHSLGHAVELADNGREALDKWRQGDYAVVLTDCHMPEMDGFELTAAIREEQGESGERTPIVAITANALQGEAETCLNAGMDGYLSKPVNLADLSKELSKWLPDTADTAAPVIIAEPAAGQPDQDVCLDLRVLRGICHDDEEAVHEMLGDFVEINETVVEALNASVANRVAEETGALAHKLKGSAGTAGARPLAESAKRLEKLAAAPEWPEIEIEAKTLATEFEKVRGEITAIRGQG